MYMYTYIYIYCYVHMYVYIYIYIYIYILTHQPTQAPVGWHCLSNATCLIRRHVFHALFTVKDHHTTLQTCSSRLKKNLRLDE